ncbi:TPA: hypothetical protein DCX15_04310, partial [bacterium]|nr:hypothetical protein [bacterium]
MKRPLVSLIIVSILATGILAWAATINWPFTTASDYTYDPAKIEVTGGVARLKALGEWHDPGWSKRKKITITGTEFGALNNYAVQINVNYISDMKPNFDDVRFTSSDGTTPLDHWRESYTDSVQLTQFKLQVLDAQGNFEKQKLCEI